MPVKEARSAFIVKPGSRVDLTRIDPRETFGFSDKDAAAKHIEGNVKRLFDAQRRLWAENKRALLIVLQGMDTSGKDGTIRHCMTGLDPSGVKVVSFKRPTEKELDHDFLWRVHAQAPGKGEIGVFNRSHYEDVLVVRVHGLIDMRTCRRRYEHIRAFESLLADSGVMVLKFFLHISKDEQKARLEERLADPTKNWKFEEGDLAERRKWDEYQRAYEDAMGATSTAAAPWFIVPSDRKWFRNLCVSQVIAETVESLKIQYPKPHVDVKKVKVR